MASRYTDKIAYKADIEQVFQNLSKKYGKFSNVLDYTENPGDHSISFSYPARGVTHGERVSIRLSSEQDNITILEIVSESIQQEFDCGNNRTHVEMILSGLGKAFEATSISAKTKRNQNSTKVAAVIAIAVLLIVVVSVVSWIVKNSGGSGSEWETCHKCGGDGKVESAVGIEVECPRCDGVGGIYTGD